MRFFAVLLALACASCGAAGVPYVPSGDAPAVEGVPSGVPSSEEPASGAAMDNPPMAGPGTCANPDDPGCPTRLVAASRSQDCGTKTLDGIPREVLVEFVSAAPVAAADEAVTVGFPSEDSPLYRDIPANVFLSPEDVDSAAEGHQVRALPDGTVRFFLALSDVRRPFDYFVTARGGGLREATGRDAVLEDSSCKPSFEGTVPQKSRLVPSLPPVHFNRQILIR